MRGSIGVISICFAFEAPRIVLLVTPAISDSQGHGRIEVVQRGYASAGRNDIPDGDGPVLFASTLANTRGRNLPGPFPDLHSDIGRYGGFVYTHRGSVRPNPEAITMIEEVVLGRNISTQRVKEGGL